MKFKEDDIVKVINKSKDYHLIDYEGMKAKIVSLPKGREKFHYEIEFNDGDFEMVTEKDIELVRSV